MIRDTRHAILETAKKLFNERGYNNVSTRDIAEELNISKGNLTYYFKKKEEIIEAILDEKPTTRVSKAPETLIELINFFNKIQKIVQENAFYFYHYTQLSQASPKIREIQLKVFQKNIEIMTQGFKNLAADGILRKEDTPGEYTRTIDTLLITIMYWASFCKLKNDNLTSELPLQAISILYPLLSDYGKSTLEEIKTTKLI